MAKRWVPRDGKGSAITVEPDTPDDSGPVRYRVWADGEKRPDNPLCFRAELLEAIYEPDGDGDA